MVVIISSIIWLLCGIYAAIKLYQWDRKNEFYYNLETINRIREKFAIRIAFGLITLIISLTVRGVIIKK
jgi:hypothetical protein